MGMLTTAYKRRIFEEYDIATAKREIEKVGQVAEPGDDDEEDDERGLRAAREIMMDPMMEPEEKAALLRAMDEKRPATLRMRDQAIWTIEQNPNLTGQEKMKLVRTILESTDKRLQKNMPVLR